MSKEFIIESWKSFYGKKIRVFRKGMWEEAYVTEDGLIYTGVSYSNPKTNK